MSLKESFPRYLVATMIAILPVGAADSQTIVQPGAPGEPSRQISAEEASDLASLQFSDADVKFMQRMITHHSQALEMTTLLAERSERDVMHRLALRIELSQKDEITMMQEWLRARDQDVTEMETNDGSRAMSMPGMLTQAEVDGLADARAVEFDRSFLELMIKHHRGALTMVGNLLSQPGTAQDSQLFAFTSEITSDQGMEINRMDAMLAGLLPDPRVDLKPGFDDAGEASWNMELVTSLPKPEGFYDPHAPRGLPLSRDRAGDSAARTEPDEEFEQDRPEENEQNDEAEAENQDGDVAERRPGVLSFANTDLAFSGDVLFEGNYHGFGIYDVENPRAPRLLSSVVCPGGQGDVSVVGSLLILSVEETRGRLDCGLQGVAEPVSAARFRGIRIFDVSDVRMARQVAAIQTCRGSHTHTVVTDPDDDGNVYVYGSGTSTVRSGDELAGCSDDSPGEDPNTALFRIDVIQIPVDRPEESQIVSRPSVFMDFESGAMAGLWKGGDHGPGTQETRQTNQCHDITAFPEIGLAAGACSGNGILLDISDPVNPVRVDQVVDPGFAYWHSATFNNDGTKVIFTDEWGGGGRPRCLVSDPKEWGADAIFDIVDRKMRLRSYFKMPAPQTEQENCVAHNGSLVPVPGRDILVQAWYQGGVSVLDFTDSAHPVEIAFFDRGPVNKDDLVMGGYWSTYWYRGFVYGTEIARGLDVLSLLPSEHLTQNEIDAATLVSQDAFNPQHQHRIRWPAHPAVARAYVDQLNRSEAIVPERGEVLRALLDRADHILMEGASDGDTTADELDTLATVLHQEGARRTGLTQARLYALTDTLRGLVEVVR